MTPSGGMWGGILESLTEGLAGKTPIMLLWIVA